MTAIRLGGGSEFNIIRAIGEALGDIAGPLGDDTAPVPPGEGLLVVSTDSSVENVHFKRAWLAPAEIGYRAAASALSDLAASAAVPAGLVVAITVPSGTPGDYIVSLMRGVRDAARRANCHVLGGDLSEGAIVTLVVTVFGYTKHRMSRAGASPGDGVWVTGDLGGARAALETWLAGAEPPSDARAAFAQPEPRIEAGLWLAKHGATAMMDISDGLGGDAEHIAAASGVALAIGLERLPLHPSVDAASRQFGESPAAFAGTGGEDYELLVTLPDDFAGALECEEATGTPIKRIGTVKPGSGVIFSVAGTTVVLTGYRHHL